MGDLFGKEMSMFKNLKKNHTKIEWSMGVSEEGLLMFNLNVCSENPETAEALFKKLHKQYCSIASKQRHKDRMFQ